MSGKNFGLLIAYVLPGFVTLWGLQDRVPAVAEWLSPSPTIPAGLESVVFVLLASITAGMSIGALRWATIDSLHHCTGLRRPAWDDGQLATHLAAFDAVVEWHYRHYQFHANLTVALAFLFALQLIEPPYPSVWMTAGFVLFEILLVSSSRNNLRRYYARSARMLGSVPHVERSTVMTNGSHPPKSTPKPEKPKSATETKKPSSKGK